MKNIEMQEFDVRQWPASGCRPVALEPRTLTIKGRLQAVGEMLLMTALILLCLFGCGDDAKAGEPVDAVVVTMLVMNEWSRVATLNAGYNPHFPFGADKRGRPIFPISHTSDGELRVGTADAYGN